MTGRQGWRGARLAAGLVGIVVALTACGDEVQVVAGDGSDTAVSASEEVGGLHPDYAGFTVPELLNGGMFAVVHGMTASEVLATLAPDPTLPETTGDEAEAWAHGREIGEWVTSVTANPVGDAVLVFEAWGSLLSEPGAAEALSREGDAVVLHDIIDGNGITLDYAVEGELVRTVGGWAEEVGEPLPAEDGLDLTSENLDMRTAYVELVERISGVDLTVEGLASGPERRGVGVALGWHSWAEQEPQTLLPEDGQITTQEDWPVLVDEDGTIVTYEGGYAVCDPEGGPALPTDLPSDGTMTTFGTLDC